MGVLRELLLSFNAFNSPQFFRFNGQPQFTNIMGGIFTILIRGLLAAFFFVKIVDVFKYNTVYANSTIKYLKNTNNSFVLSPADKASPFLMMLEVRLDPLSSNKNLTQFKDNITGWARNATGNIINLEHCTSDHWFYALDSYQTIMNGTKPNEAYFFCLPQNYSQNLSTNDDSHLQIAISLNCGTNCHNTSYLKLKARPIVHNRLINAQHHQNYIEDIIEKTRYYDVDTSGASFMTQMTYSLSKYTIDTDSSLFPWARMKTENGIFILEQPIVTYVPNYDPQRSILRMVLNLDKRQYVHYRYFSKVFDAMSSIGGLIPACMMLCIWLFPYAQAHFEMTFVKKLHSDQMAKQYGISDFFSKMVYMGLSFFNFDLKKWQKAQEYNRMQKIVKQHLLDVIYLYRRLEFIQRTLQIILEDHQKKVLHLMRNKTFKQADQNYRLYQMKENLAKCVKKMKNKKQKRTKQFKQKQIILEPVQTIHTNKNLITMQDFEGDLQDGDSPIKTIQEVKHNNSKKEEQFKQDMQIQDSDYNQEVEEMEMEELRKTYSSYLQLKQEAEDANSDYFSVISKNIYLKLDDVDLGLLRDLQYLLNPKIKSEISADVRNSLKMKRNIINENQYKIRSRKNQISESIESDIRSSDIQCKKISNGKKVQQAQQTTKKNKHQ